MLFLCRLFMKDHIDVTDIVHFSLPPVIFCKESDMAHRKRNEIHHLSNASKQELHPSEDLYRMGQRCLKQTITRIGCSGSKTSNLHGLARTVRPLPQARCKLYPPLSYSKSAYHPHPRWHIIRDTLYRSKVTGISQSDKLQNSVKNLIGDQGGENSLLAPV